MTSSITAIFPSAGVVKAFCKWAHQLTLDTSKFLTTTLEIRKKLTHLPEEEADQRANPSLCSPDLTLHFFAQFLPFTTL